VSNPSTTPTTKYPLSTWTEVQLENASDHEVELGKPCKCGVTLRDHYGARDASGRESWRPCSAVNGGAR
jgi:hypothetical protein